ncbi:phage-related minor tail protein [Sphingomonas sp. BE123]|jgi:phage-related minor tail protein|uniref:tail tape measure protein n=1 Tax=Sphingomonas sp. BE123 TaxID=2817842 RepID=UPI00285837DC|nr:tail tape measure protein [Sphingomonas sp. BE123]MDR6852146.1 phage-related minor tail protein [Sphingomonas sp. BE123]
MGEDLDEMMVRVRADTRGFARDVAEMRAAIDGPLQAGADRAGRGVEQALLRAARTGKLGFEDLQRVASQILSEIAAEAVRAGLSSLFGGGGGGGGLGAAIGSLFGLPGRATGGPVAPGRGYIVGERGPELFVPTSSGRVEVPLQGGGREVRVAITINAPGGGEAAGALRQSGRQVARAVKAALAGVE